MNRKEAYLEIGLSWRDDDAFDVTIAYDDRDDVGDRRAFSSEPIAIEDDALRQLVADDAAYGQRLSDMVFAPENIRRFYEQVRGLRDGQESPLHLRLLIDPDAPFRYHNLRWELLCDPLSGTPLAVMPNVFVSRFLSARGWPPLVVPRKHDLRAAVVVANPSDIVTIAQRDSASRRGEVNVDAELERALLALGDIPTTILAGEPGVTAKAIMEVLEAGIDVLYLVCHASTDLDGAPLLYFERTDGTADPVMATAFAAQVKSLACRPVLAVVCSPSMGWREAATTDGNALAGLGPPLAAAGVAAVVAMQSNITMATFAQFMPQFFRELSADGVIDRAFAVARAAIMDRSDWWVPVLFSRLKRGRIYYLPEFGARNVVLWRLLTHGILTRRCTPLIGSGLADDILVPRSEVARNWADSRQLPIPANQRGELDTVAQYLSVQVGGHIAYDLASYLVRVFRERYRGRMPDDQLSGDTATELARAIGAWRRQHDADDSFAAVASLGLPIFVTTDWTTLLQDALVEAGKEPTVRRFEWFAERDERAAEEIAAPTVDKPLVYHLFGTLDEPNTLVLTGDDYFSWLAAWNRNRTLILPDPVGTALTRSSLLFLGYRPDDWDFRALFQSIKTFGHRDMLRRRPHVAVINPQASMVEPEAAQDYLESYLDQDKVSIYWGNSRSFLAELHEKLAADDDAGSDGKDHRLETHPRSVSPRDQLSEPADRLSTVTAMGSSSERTLDDVPDDPSESETPDTADPIRQTDEPLAFPDTDDPVTTDPPQTAIRAVPGRPPKRDAAASKQGNTPHDGAGVSVFLCHSSGDKAMVRDLEGRLRRDGMKTWLDEQRLIPGQDWDHAIRRAVRAADVVVVCLSRAAINKAGYIQKEMRYVLDAADEQPEESIFLIPARLEECEMPERLRRWHRVDLFQRGGYDRLMLALQMADAARRRG